MAPPLTERPFREEFARGSARLLVGLIGAALSLAGYIGVQYLGEALDAIDEKRRTAPK